MYEELIGELHIVASGVQSKRRRELLEKAADAIEQLSAFVNQFEDGHMYIMRDGVVYRSEYTIPKEAKTVTIPPIEFAEPPKEETE